LALTRHRNVRPEKFGAAMRWKDRRREQQAKQWIAERPDITLAEVGLCW
jgi:hypothetical protein